MKRVLASPPSQETAPVRAVITRHSDPALPFCPAHEGDLLHRLITKHGCQRCLEVGFATGSTALYMLDALRTTGGELVSIDRPSGPYNDVGKRVVGDAHCVVRPGSHRLIEQDSALAVPDLFRAGERFDLIFVDGWKTFDHLAAEAYYLTRMLNVGGVLMFDDTAMPSVDKVCRLLETHYGYREIDYRACGQTVRLRAFQILTSKSMKRPCRAFIKTDDERDLPVTQDWNFFVPF